MTGPRPSASAAATAASTTSGRITMPGPPPNGVSSTEWCLSRAKLRISTLSRAQMPDSSACPASDWPSGPGNIAGNSVKTRTVQSGSAIGADSVRTRFGVGRGIDNDASRTEIDDRHKPIGEREQFRRAVEALDLQDAAGAVVLNVFDAPVAGTVREIRPQAD